MHLKMSSGKWRPFCLGLNVFITCSINLWVSHKAIFVLQRNRHISEKIIMLWSQDEDCVDLCVCMFVVVAVMMMTTTMMMLMLTMTTIPMKLMMISHHTWYDERMWIKLHSVWCVFLIKRVCDRLPRFLWNVHWLILQPGPWFNIKMPSYQYRKSHCGDKTVVRSSYLHNGISYTGKMTSLYWFSPQTVSSPIRIILYNIGNAYQYRFQISYLSNNWPYWENFRMRDIHWFVMLYGKLIGHFFHPNFVYSQFKLIDGACAYRYVGT